MKRLIFVVTVVCFLAGVVIITTGKLQSQVVQTEQKIKQNQTGKPIPPKPKVDMIPEPTERDTSSAIESQKIFRVKIRIKSEQEREIVKRIGLECEGKTECICNATEGQVDELRSLGIEFEVVREGIKVEKGSAYGQNENNYSIPQGDWIYSPITITSAPAG